MTDITHFISHLGPQQLRALALFSVLNIPIMVLLGKVFFGNLACFLEALKYSYISPYYWYSTYWQDSFYNRMVATGLVEVYLLLFLGLMAAEVYFFA